MKPNKIDQFLQDTVAPVLVALLKEDKPTQFIVIPLEGKQLPEGIDVYLLDGYYYIYGSKITFLP